MEAIIAEPVHFFGFDYCCTYLSYCGCYWRSICGPAFILGLESYGCGVGTEIRCDCGVVVGIYHSL